MRAALVASLLVVAAHGAAAEPLPPFAIGGVFGGIAGAGPDNARVGDGLQWGFVAAWQPMKTEKPWGVVISWDALFSWQWQSIQDMARAAKIDFHLGTVQMDLMAGVRFRPWTTASRYLTVRGGGELLRANDPIVGTQRSFVGGIASVGIDQYFGAWMLGVNLRYGLIGSGPGELALLFSVSRTGP